LKIYHDRVKINANDVVSEIKEFERSMQITPDNEDILTSTIPIDLYKLINELF